MNMLKKQTVGSCFAIITLLLGIVSFIVYDVNISGQGYFHGASVDVAVRYMILAIAVGLCVVVLANLPLKEGAAKCVTFISDLGRIALPAILVAALLTIVSARVEGFAFIYFSNAEVLQEVQTPANISSAHGAIANIVCLAVTAVVGIIGAFFSTKKAEQ